MSRKWLLSLAIVVIISLILAACASEPRMVETVFERGVTMKEEAAYAPDFAAPSGQATAGVITNIKVQERLIIRNADLAIVVDDAETAINTIEKLVSRAEGWVVNSNVWESDDIKRGSIIVRIPADGLDAFLEEIHRLANQVTNETISGEDVTEEFVDLEARLRNLEATAARVRSFLDEAKDVDDALAVNAELSRLEQEIEQISGRMQFLEQSARFSQVSIEVTPDALAQPVAIGRWRPQGTARTAIEALVKTLQSIANVVIFAALYLLPIGVIFGVPLFFVIRFLARKQKQRAQAELAIE
jgi:hypothetical protein